MGLLGGTAEHLLAREGVAVEKPLLGGRNRLNKRNQARGSQRAPTLSALGTGFGDGFTSRRDGGAPQPLPLQRARPLHNLRVDRAASCCRCAAELVDGDGSERVLVYVHSDHII
jgi:hypothetical protein